MAFLLVLMEDWLEKEEAQALSAPLTMDGFGGLDEGKAITF